MTKSSVDQWDATAANNTDVGGISLAENVMKPPAVNNAFREVMAQIKAGVPYLSTTSIVLPATTTNLNPDANDGAALGASGTAWSDLFLASGAVVNFAAGDVTITHSANTLAFAGASSGGYTFDSGVTPASNDGAALGGSGIAWSDLFLASGAVINFAGGDVTITHSANQLAIAGAVNGYTVDAVLTPSANDGAALGASGTAWSDLFLASGAVVNFSAGDVTVTHSANTLAFAGASSGYSFDALIDLAGGQIKFPASQSASSDANTLDDYEEGTFSPNVTASSGTITGTGGTAGTYTKIGNRVLWSHVVTITNNGTGAGLIRVANMPFAAGASHSAYGRETFNTGKSLNGEINAATSQLTLALYDGTYPGATNNVLRSGGHYTV